MAHIVTAPYNAPPYYYTKLHPTTPGGAYLPVVRISRSGGGYPSIYVRVQDPGDYNFPVGLNEIEQLYVARIDYATVIRAYNSSQSQFIRSFYPPPGFPGVPAHELVPTNPLQPAGISYIPHAPSNTLNTLPTIGPTVQARPISSKRSVPAMRGTIALDDFDLLHGVPVLDIHGELLNPVNGSPVFSDVSSSPSSSMNISRSALNHYISPARSHRTGSSVSSRRSESPVSRMSSSPPTTSFIPSRRAESPIDGLVRQHSGMTADLVSYQDSGSSYSSFDLYNPGTSPVGGSLRRKASRPYMGNSVMAYGAGLGMSGPPVLVGGEDRGSRRWFKG